MTATTTTVGWLKNVRADSLADCKELENGNTTFVGLPRADAKRRGHELTAAGFVGLYDYANKPKGTPVVLDRLVIDPRGEPVAIREVVAGPGLYAEGDPFVAYPERIQVAPVIRCPNARCPTNQLYADKPRRPSLHKYGRRGSVVYYRCQVCRDDRSRPTTFSILVMEPGEFVRRFGRASVPKPPEKSKPAAKPPTRGTSRGGPPPSN